jgi:hypothetical protein
MTSALPAQKEDRVVFTAGAKNFSVRDVIDAAHFRGEIDSHWTELLARLAAEKHAVESEAEVDNSAIDAAAVAFRYEHDLITAEETERWLELRGMTLADFGDHFVRAYWGETFSSEANSTAAPFHQSSAELRQLLAVELILNDQLDPMTTALAWRVAAVEGFDVVSAPVQAERERFTARTGFGAGEIQAWLHGLGRDDLWFEQTLTAEAAFHARCDKLFTEEAQEREIRALRLPLTRFEVETIEFDSRDAASEAVWCVRSDGMSMAEVAQEGRYPYQRTELVLEEISEDLQQKFLSLTPGSILEPIPRDDGFQLARLLGKAEPKLDDPGVRSRVAERILARHFADLTSKCIRMEIMPMSTE